MKPTIVLFALLGLTACSDYTPTEKRFTVDPATHQVTLPSPCPDWSSPTENYDNSKHSNFGCATANNIAIQLDDPADAIEGHGAKTPNTETTVRTIQRYNAGEIPEPLVPLSDIGGD
jgi:hypothetical protein